MSELCNLQQSYPHRIATCLASVHEQEDDDYEPGADPEAGGVSLKRKGALP